MQPASMLDAFYIHISKIKSKLGDDEIDILIRIPYHDSKKMNDVIDICDVLKLYT